MAILSLVLHMWSLTAASEKEQLIYKNQAAEANTILRNLIKDPNEALSVCHLLLFLFKLFQANQK